MELMTSAERGCALAPQALFVAQEKQLYLMADPFNRSYNPAKVQADSEIASSYKNAFRRAYIDLKKGVSLLQH